MVGIAPLDSTLGARVTDVALGDMSAAEWREIEDAFHEYGALVFPAQHLSDDEHIAFGERFGGHRNPARRGQGGARLQQEGRWQPNEAGGEALPDAARQ